MTAGVAPKDQARDLEADLAICEAATPGPWFECGLTNGYVIDGPLSVVASVIEYDADGTEGSMLGGERFFVNRKFIAEARQGWPYAIRRAMEAEAEIDRLHNELQIQQEQRSRSERLIYQEQRNGGGGCGD